MLASICEQHVGFAAIWVVEYGSLKEFIFEHVEGQVTLLCPDEWCVFPCQFCQWSGNVQKMRHKFVVVPH